MKIAYKSCNAFQKIHSYVHHFLHFRKGLDSITNGICNLHHKNRNRAMDQAQKNSLMMVLNTWWKDQTCEVCKNKLWTIAEEIFTPIQIANNSLLLGGTKSYPQAMAICVHCGNTKYFNMIILGIHPKNDEDGNG